jgi:hypothetical protein
MWHFRSAAVILMAMGALLFGAGQARCAGQSDAGIVVVPVGPFATQNVERIVKFVEESLHVPVYIRTAQDKVAFSENGEPVSLLPLAAPEQVICLLVLDGTAADTKSARTVFKPAKVAVVNAARLKPAAEGQTDSTEQWMRRLEKESLAAIGLLLGLDKCANPFCALFDHESDFELDAKARSLCPPCSGKALEVLTRKGATLKFEQPAPAKEERK